jgi:hypothetical protein
MTTKLNQTNIGGDRKVVAAGVSPAVIWRSALVLNAKPMSVALATVFAASFVIRSIIESAHSLR